MSETNNKGGYPSGNDMSRSLFVDSEGDLMHFLLSSVPIDGVFRWENNLDFFSDIEIDDDYEDDDLLDP
jgi:hypothetical protein